MGGLLDSVSGALFGGDDSFDRARGAANQNRALYENIALPQYDKFNPELFTPGEEYKYKTISEDPTIRSAQMSALQKMSGLADTGLSDVDAAGFAKARAEGAQMAKSGTDAAIQNAQARGVGGSGLEFAMREMANQGGAQRAQEAGLQQAADSARQRALYSQAYGSALGGMRGQDFNANSANTDIINKYNQMNTQNHNATANQNVGLRNDAFQYNEGLKDKNYGNQMKRADGMAGINNRMAEIDSAEGAQKQQRNNSILGGLIQGGAAYAGRK